MMSTDTEMISKYLEEILQGVQDRENDELIQNVQQLADLSNFLLDKILCAQYQLNEQQSQHETELFNQQSEINYHKQIVEQLQRIIQEDQVRTKQLYESLVSLEDNLKNESTQNILMSNQLECVSSHNREHQTEQNKVIRQQQVEIEQLKISLTYYRDMASRLQTEKQVLQDKHIVDLNTIKEIEQTNQSLTSQLIQLKHELQNKGEDITNNNSIDYHQSKNHSILKEIQSSPYILRSQRTSQKVLQYTSSNNKYSELQLDVKHFSILDTELTENQPPTATFQYSKRNSIIFRRLDSIIGTESNIPNTGRVSRNPYQDFFNLICQCAKLNCKQMERILEVRTQHLFDEYIQKNIPYHKWYREVDRYLKQFI